MNMTTDRTLARDLRHWTRFATNARRAAQRLLRRGYSAGDAELLTTLRAARRARAAVQTLRAARAAGEGQA